MAIGSIIAAGIDAYKNNKERVDGAVSSAAQNIGSAARDLYMRAELNEIREANRPPKSFFSLKTEEERSKFHEGYKADIEDNGRPDGSPEKANFKKENGYDLKPGSTKEWAKFEAEVLIPRAEFKENLNLAKSNVN